MGGLSRRQAFAGFGSVSLGALLGACSNDDDSAGAGNTDTSRFDRAAHCTRTAEETEGPFYSERGETFLRGLQVTNRDGIAEFTTIYPGWYPGRTVHIHGKVHLDKRTVLTTQFYFADSFTDRVFAREPYRSDRGRDAFNATDPLYQRDLELTLSKEGGAYSGMITLDIA